MSYTTFKYENLKVTTSLIGAEDDIVVSFDLTNTGSRDGDEVARVYARQTTASVATPVRALKAFSREHLRAGETKCMTLRIKRSDLEVWSATQEWKLEPGEFTLWVGGSSDAKLTSKFSIN